MLQASFPIYCWIVAAAIRSRLSCRAAAGLRRQFSPTRPPGLGGAHCALRLLDAVSYESGGGSPVQGYKGQSPGKPTVLVGSQGFRSGALIGVEQESRLEPFAALCTGVQAAG